MGGLFRLVINLVLAALVLLGLNALGWVQLHTPGIAVPTTQDLFLNALLIALIFVVVKTLLDLIFGLLVAASCGVGCILLPVYAIVVGYAALAVIAHYLPEYLTLTSNPWLGILSGILLGIVQIHGPLHIHHTNDRWRVEWEDKWGQAWRSRRVPPGGPGAGGPGTSGDKIVDAD